jgi:crossover junction endodeoxyribonuclease RuvC
VRVPGGFCLNERVTTSEAYRVLGVDPGLNITGYGAVDFRGSAFDLVEAGCIRTVGKRGIAPRIAQIFADLTDLIEELQPHAIAVEKLYAHYAHPRTAIQMAHARGVILLAAERAGIAVRDLPATKIKKNLTGNGHATKQQVQRTIQSVCGLTELPSPPDVADALAIALCAGRMAVL